MLTELNKGTNWLSSRMQVFSHSAMSNYTQRVKGKIKLAKG